MDGSRVHVPDWSGNLCAVNRQTGQVVWQRTIASYTGIPGDRARATPAVKDGVLYVANQGPFGGGGAMLAIDAATGNLLWTAPAGSRHSPGHGGPLSASGRRTRRRLPGRSWVARPGKCAEGSRLAAVDRSGYLPASGRG